MANKNTQRQNGEVNVFGITTFRNQIKQFGIKRDDRRRHMYIIGKTGSGKTTLLQNMAINDILSGNGLGVVDPHGEFAETLLDFVPEERIDDVVYFNPADIDHPIGFNPLEQVNDEQRHLVASGIMGVFKKIWPDVWSARMEYILSNALLALLEYPGSTLLGIMRILTDKDYRKEVVANLKDPVVKNFWINEFGKYTQQFAIEATAAILNKVGQFVSNPLIRNIIGQTKSTINMREIMDKKKILIVNLSKGRIGEDNSALLGAMMITKLQLAAMSRVDIPEEKRSDFYLYVDEFQNFATESFVTILSEARKYRLNLILAHQYIEQLEERVRSAVFGNIGTLIAFRIGATDAEEFEKEFLPEFDSNHLVNLSKYNMYVKLMIDGFASRPFSAMTIRPQSKPAKNYKDIIIENNRLRYSLSRVKVEEKIAAEWLASQKQIEEKVLQRSEMPLSKVLTPFERPRPSGYGQGPRPSYPPRPAYPQRSSYQSRPSGYGQGPRQPRPSQEKEPPRPKSAVNIEELKKTIEESLKKVGKAEDEE